MAPFSMSLIVDTGSRLRLRLDLPGPVRWSELRAEICRAAGLAPDALLYLGAEPVPDDWPAGVPPLLTGTVVGCVPGPEPDTDGMLEVVCLAGPDAGRAAWFVDRPLVIGRDPEADLSVADPELSHRHAELTLTSTGVELTDLGSTNGIWVDGGRHPGGPLPGGAIIRLGGSLFTVRLGRQPPLSRRPDGRGRIAVSRRTRILAGAPPAMADDPGPPPVRRRRTLPIAAVLVSGITGAALSAVTGNLLFLLLAGLGPVTMIGTAVADRIAGRRSHGRELRRYTAAAREYDASVDAAVAAERRQAWATLGDPAGWRTGARRGDRLWERRPGHPDFATVIVGSGVRRSRLPVTDPSWPVDSPVTLDLRPGAVVGIAGQTDGLVRALVVQLVAAHSPVDLRICWSGHGSGPFTDGCALRDLPHHDPARYDPPRYRAGPDDALTEDRATDHDGPATVVFSAGPVNGREPGADAGTGRAVVHLAPTVAELPGSCTTVIRVRPGRATLTSHQGSVDCEPLSLAPDLTAAIFDLLAPLTEDGTQARGPLPGRVTSDELMTLPSDPVALRRSWADSRATAVLGVGPGGPVVLDLDRDGPHLLIAGTTGAGKSELLTTLVAGLAAAAPPSDTSFLLIDYKGGAGFADLAPLPHTVGLVTDLDPALAERGLTSLRAEIRSRERLLAGSGATGLAELRAAAGAAPARLVIVVDEFAALAGDLPGFLAGLVDVAQRGRSLGLHLVLATQRPAGVVSPAIRANTSARICLRVVDEADSRDVIDRPDAAWLPVDTPGRALLRVGQGAPVQFQTALSTTAPIDRVAVRRADHQGADDPAAPGRPAGRSVAQRLVDAAVTAWADRPRPEPPWQPALPAHYRPADPTVFGLIDEPERQRRTAVPPPPGSLLVTGPPGSGRSQALHRWAGALLAQHREGQLILIDPGRSLSQVAGWSATSTALDGSDPSLVLRVLDRLAAVLADRARTPDRPITLLFDGWDALVGPLDQVDFGAWTGRLADLAARGPAVGIRIGVAGAADLGHHRIAAAFLSRVVLAGGGPVRGGGVAGGNVPRGNGGGGAGRGRLMPAGVEIQVALPDSSVEPGPAPRPEDDRDRLVVVPLPTTVTGEMLGDPGGRWPAPGGAFLPIGLGGDAARPVGPTLSGGGFLVAGPPRSGVSTALTAIAVAAAGAGVPVIVLGSGSGAAIAAVVRRWANGPRSAWPEAGLVEAAPESASPWIAGPIDLRRGPADLLEVLATLPGRLLLIVDRGDELPDPIADVVVRFLQQAGPGRSLALGARLDRAVRALRGPVAETAANRCGLLLAADATDGACLGARLPRRRGPAPPGRGQLIDSGAVLELQVARWD